VIGLANPNPPLCDRCGNDDRDGLTEVACGDLLCPGCVDSRAERQQEREAEAYYGGCEPTMRERRAL
jgi:late competence protein required for DNA uptake (superfamily II DNA/RNA helicase)